VNDPCDMGALLSAALAASGLTAAELSRRTGIAPPHVYRALASPNARPPTVRRILRAIGARLTVQR
jgi:DNA-binding phage protein